VYILLDDVSGSTRWDVMYKFVTGVHRNLEDIIQALSEQPRGEPFPFPGAYTVQATLKFDDQTRTESFVVGPPALGAAGNWRDIAAKDLP
jgi:hypothetical protein